MNAVELRSIRDFPFTQRTPASPRPVEMHLLVYTDVQSAQRPVYGDWKKVKETIGNYEVFPSERRGFPVCVRVCLCICMCVYVCMYGLPW